MKNKEAAEDVLQEAYMKAFSKLEKLSEAGGFLGWVGELVSNYSHKALVKEKSLPFARVFLGQQW